MKGLDKITAGRVRLLFTNPFFGVLATDMKVIETDKVQTAGVDGVHLFFNPTFTDTLSKGEIEFVLAHEVLHLVLLTHLRRGFRDMKVWNQATDYTINQILKDEHFTLVQSCLIDEKFKDWSSEKIYEYLMENPEEQQQDEEWNIGAVSDSPGAGEQASPAKIKELEAEMNGKTQAAAMSALKAGKMPGQLESIINDICAPKADWRDILQRFVSEKAMLDYNFSLCHTRMLQQYGIINPVLDGEKLGEVAILVDTSGSVTDEELAQFAGEINDIIENYECRTTVVYCDTQVNRVDIFEGDEPITMHAVGRGGTMQAPGYEYIRDNITNPACLIHYSDGEVFDWDAVEHPGCPAILACNMPTVPDDTPDWLEVVDIT